jgi:hypothetical protein
MAGKLKSYATVQLRKENESYLKREFWVERAFFGLMVISLTRQEKLMLKSLKNILKVKGKINERHSSKEQALAAFRRAEDVNS